VATIDTAQGTIHSRRYAWLEPAIPDLPSAKRYTALDVICPNPACLALASTPCRAARVCQERVAEALRRNDSISGPALFGTWRYKTVQRGIKAVRARTSAIPKSVPRAVDF
jgi:hypothetical protein